MSREISRWGVGPNIMLSAGAYAAFAGLVTWLWPEVCLVTAVPDIVFLVAGIVLLAIGIPVLVVAARAATLAYNSDKLDTTGLFGLARHPIYSAWIAFIIPGLVLLSRSWPLLLTPLVAYFVFKIKIGREDEYLEQRFGEQYRRYRIMVNELLPVAETPMTGPVRLEAGEERKMATFIHTPTVIQAAGRPPKSIEEFVGRVNSGTTAVSIARMKSPAGWAEPGQTPEFAEYTVVLRGTLHVELKDGEFDVEAGQAITVTAGEWVQYSSPSPEGAEYIAVCIPAFSPATVYRE